MEPKEQNGKGDLKAGKKAITSYAKYSAVAFQMISIIGGFTYAGYKIDEKRNSTTPFFTAGLSLAGVFLSLYLVIRSIKSQR